MLSLPLCHDQLFQQEESLEELLHDSWHTLLLDKISDSQISDGFSSHLGNFENEIEFKTVPQSLNDSISCLDLFQDLFVDGELVPLD